MTSQPDLFGAETALPVLPAGFRYKPDFISAAEQSGLIEAISPLPFREFEFHGFLGKRRTVSFGWKYDFSTERINRIEDMPDFLLPFRERAAAFAGITPADLQQVLVTEYTPGAGIGWHKDKAVFGEVVGISLAASCTFRLRRRHGDKWERRSLITEPGSAYLISGEARSEWEHSIPPVEALRYSITFRSVRG